MKYKIFENSGNFDVLEMETDLVIEVQKPKKDALAIVRKLSLGAGFQGFTPTFFCMKRA